jgi:spore maturation protein SpmB
MITANMEIFKNGLKNGLQISFKIVPYIIPIYIFVDFFKNTSVFIKIASFFNPLMSLLGLPGKASIVILSGFLINLYAAIGAMIPIALTPKQITIIGLVLGISHNLIVESIILSKSGVKAYITVTFRIFIGILIGIMVNQLWNLIS